MIEGYRDTWETQVCPFEHEGGPGSADHAKMNQVGEDQASHDHPLQLGLELCLVVLGNGRGHVLVIKRHSY